MHFNNGALQRAGEGKITLTDFYTVLFQPLKCLSFIQYYPVFKSNTIEVKREFVAKKNSRVKKDIKIGKTNCNNRKKKKF